jgi:hypothetical protein
MKKIKYAVALVVAVLVLATTACSSAADTASSNLSKAADNFEIQRRIVFINGITDKYLLVIEGRCSLGNNDKSGELTVTCKVGPNEYKKSFLGLSDNVTYLVEQMEPASADDYHYRVNFRPETLVPDIRN